MSEPELSRTIKLRPLPADPVVVEADASEREALAKRFGVHSIDSLSATVELENDGKAVLASGMLMARLQQDCAISGDPFDVSISEPLALRFIEQDRPDPALSEEEIEVELAADELDEIEYSGDSFDLGEAIAQSLGLAIDPYAEGPHADATRKQAGLGSDDEPSGPLAEALKALKKD